MLIVISHTEMMENESYYIEKFLNEGVDYFHIRKPALSDFEAEKLVKKIPEYLLPKLSIHGNYSLLNKFNLGGIHFTSKTKHSINDYKNLSLRKSISCHSFKEIDSFINQVDYAFLSPVFNSISKKNYSGKFNGQETKSFLENHLKEKIVALGGISESNIEKVYELGFTSAAMLGSIWENPEKISIIREVKKYV